MKYKSTACGPPGKPKGQGRNNTSSGTRKGPVGVVTKLPPSQGKPKDRGVNR